MWVLHSLLFPSRKMLYVNVGKSGEDQASLCLNNPLLLFATALTLYAVVRNCLTTLSALFWEYLYILWRGGRDFPPM